MLRRRPDLDTRYRTEDGWVRTGDLGLIDDDGTLRVVGRLKDVVIRGGANISPAEVEVELAAHPAVRDVVCVGVPDPLMGERLAACVVPRDEAAPTLEELCAHLDTRGLERRKHPERLLVLSELPLTPWQAGPGGTAGTVHAPGGATAAALGFGRLTRRTTRAARVFPERPLSSGASDQEAFIAFSSVVAAFL